MVQGSMSKLSTPTADGPCGSGPEAVTFAEAKSLAQTKRRNRVRSYTASTRSCFRDIYQKGEKLGGGAYASVYSCYRKHPTKKDRGREFAVKIIEKNHPTHSRQRCLNEVELFYKCRLNEHIIKVEETFDEEDTFYIIFEKLYGGPLMHAIGRMKSLNEREVVQVVRELANAIAFLHSINIAHRDLKPDNILCVNSDSISPVKICDLDLGSKIEINIAQCGGMTPQLLTPVGSAEYMAPEVVESFVSDDAGPYDKRCDLWSLGVVIYMLLCGYPPFCGSCGEDCDWAKGGSCRDCQDNLFCNIQEGLFMFPERDWNIVDPMAKDLITKLLVKNPKERLSAEMILDHPWVKGGGSDTLLNTCGNIRLYDSGADKISKFACSAMQMNTIVTQHEQMSYLDDEAEMLVHQFRDIEYGNESSSEESGSDTEINISANNAPPRNLSTSSTLSTSPSSLSTTPTSSDSLSTTMSPPPPTTTSTFYGGHSQSLSELSPPSYSSLMVRRMRQKDSQQDENQAKANSNLPQARMASHQGAILIPQAAR